MTRKDLSMVLSLSKPNQPLEIKLISHPLDGEERFFNSIGTPSLDAPIPDISMESMAPSIIYT